MRKMFFFSLVITTVLYCTSCARGISVHDAANGKAKCKRYIK